jgi:hypothetical protein
LNFSFNFGTARERRRAKVTIAARLLTSAEGKLMKLMVPRGFGVTFPASGFDDGAARRSASENERKPGVFHFFHFVHFGAAVRALARSRIGRRGGRVMPHALS